MTDPLDPRTWPIAEPPRRLYLDDTGELFATLDQVDYDWAIQWLWFATPNSTAKKFYATRNTRIAGSLRKQIKLYLHKEILIRTGRPRPTPHHTISDHEDGDSLNCRRNNLRWATPKMNRENRGGWFALQGKLFRGEAAHG
jgi:hypothetical protein